MCHPIAQVRRSQRAMAGVCTGGTIPPRPGQKSPLGGALHFPGLQKSVVQKRKFTLQYFGESPIGLGAPRAGPVRNVSPDSSTGAAKPTSDGRGVLQTGGTIPPRPRQKSPLGGGLHFPGLQKFVVQKRKFTLQYFGESPIGLGAPRAGPVRNVSPDGSTGAAKPTSDGRGVLQTGGTIPRSEPPGAP